MPLMLAPYQIWEARLSRWWPPQNQNPNYVTGAAYAMFSEMQWAPGETEFPKIEMGHQRL